MSIPPVKGFADVSASWSQFDIVCFSPPTSPVSLACHRQTWTGRKPTLSLAVRRSLLVDSNTALVGVIPATSFVRFKGLRGTFSGERSLSHPFGCWEFVAVVETRHVGCKEESKLSPNPNGNECLCCHHMPRTSGPTWRRGLELCLGVRNEATVQINEV